MSIGKQSVGIFSIALVRPYSVRPAFEQKQSRTTTAFWKANKDRFPAFAQAAPVFLSASCTSVDSEQPFSTAGLI